MKRHLINRLGIQYVIDDDAVKVKMWVESKVLVWWMKATSPKHKCALAPGKDSRKIGSMAPNAKLEAKVRRAAVVRRERARACAMQRAFQGHLKQTWREKTGESTTLAVTVRIG